MLLYTTRAGEGKGKREGGEGKGLLSDFPKNHLVTYPSSQEAVLRYAGSFFLLCMAGYSPLWSFNIGR